MTTDTDPDSKQPLRFESPPLGFGDQQQFQQTQTRQSKALWGIFGLLLALTAGVVFVLPSLVQPVAPPVTTVVSTAPAPAAAPEPAPFAEAQRMKSRQEAQDVLAPLLDLQKALEKQQVTQWAGAEFTAALALAQQGDSAYSSQRYAEALQLYQQASSAMQAIEARIPQQLSEQLAAGRAALAAGDAKAADAAYSIAILLDPNNSEAVTGMERARSLDKVMALLEEAQSLQADNELEAARSKYQEILSVDNGNPEAVLALQQIATAQANANFAAIMSRGFAALQNGDTAAAKAAFEQAGALRPGASEVSAALQQASDMATQSAVAVHIQAAQAAEANEEWATALAEWNAALAIDANLVSAQDGQRRTQSRTNLDNFLVDTLANPLRLGDAAVYAQTEQVLSDAQRLLTPGPKLQQQMTQVQAYLARAKVPVAVTIQSDGQTNVSLRGVGELGLLSSHTLQLPPGTYVAVGVRAGYRDVRQEFVVGLDGQPVQVTVSCSEGI